MRTLLLLRRPLARRSVIFCHVMAQLGWLVGGAAWLALRSPWLAPVSWGEAWPTLLLGGALLLLAMVGTRLLAELLMLPHYLASMRQGFAPSAVVTRSFERRPAVHDADEAWTSAARRHDGEDTVLGEARVAEHAAPARRRQRDAAASTPGREGVMPRQEPRL